MEEKGYGEVNAGYSAPPPPGYGQQYPSQPAYSQPAYGQPAAYSNPNVTVVSQAPPTVVQHTLPQRDYLIVSIISIFFFWPVAICAIAYAVNARNSYQAGDCIRAQSQGNIARNLAITSIILGIVLYIILIVLHFVVWDVYVCYGYGC